MEQNSMLDFLHQVEVVLPLFLQDESGWHSLFVDYHKPYVERLWRPWQEGRIYLHRILPCTMEESLFHPHPWPSAMRVLEGSYEMTLGSGSGSVPPPVAARLILSPGSEYEMGHIDGWHAVRPIRGVTMSLMVTGEPWQRWSPRSDKALSPLSEEAHTRILQFFQDHYR